MSFKDNSESDKFSKKTQREQKRGSSIIQLPVGRERAWEYLLRRKAEGITGRIHKVNERSMNHPAESYIPLCSTGVEEPERSREPYKRDVSGFPIKTCVSSSSAHCSGLAFVPNEGFWLDRTGSRQDQRNILSSHSVYGKHNNNTNSELSEHLKVHPKCQCGQYFAGEIITNHWKRCPLFNPSCCHVCGKKVKTNSALSEHLKVHSKCQCGQYFMGEISKTHMNECTLLMSPCCHFCGEKVSLGVLLLNT